MKIIRFIMIIALFVGLTVNAEAQILKKIQKAAERGVERTILNRTERETSAATDDAIDTALGKDKAKSNTKNTNTKTAGDKTGEKESVGGSLEAPPSLSEEGGNEVGFKRGSKILYTDNFEPDAVGDFPAKWNTSDGGEVKRLTGFSEKWLRIPARSLVSLDMKEPLPPNFTVEFDVILPADVPYRIVGIGLGQSLQKMETLLSSSKAYGLVLYSHDSVKDGFLYGVSKSGDATLKRKQYVAPLNQKIHVAIEVNNHERIRTYVDGVKMNDAPRDFKPELAQNFYFHAITHGDPQTRQNYFYVSNIVIAETGTDERSSVLKDLIEKGTFTTNDILFASGSDKIESSSANILNQIGEAMKTAPNNQFLIIGHTDSDGSDDANQKLSQDRANSVKNYLVDNLSVNGANLMAVGKGESEPVAENSTAEGKAKNRRVEFRKL